MSPDKYLFPTTRKFIVIKRGFKVDTIVANRFIDNVVLQDETGRVVRHRRIPLYKYRIDPEECYKPADERKYDLEFMDIFVDPILLQHDTRSKIVNLAFMNKHLLQ